MMTGPLTGVRVLDLSQFLSGPRAGQILSMQGADVLKIESPIGDTMRLIMTMTGSQRTMHTLHQGKRGMVLDLGKPGSGDLLLKLAAKADVLIENFAPNVMEKLGLGYERFAAVNSRLIYASIRGFGRSGPLADRTAFDLIAQATGGTMFASHAVDRPPGVFFGDLCAGAYAAIGILSALHERERTGRGKLIDISMQDVIYFHNFWAFSDRATLPDHEQISGLLGGSMENLLSDPDNPMPFWNSYKASDGYVVVVALTDKQWRALMDVIERPDMKADPRFASFVDRIRNAKDGIGAVTEWTAARTVDEVIAALSARQIPCGLVQDYQQLMVDPQLEARGMLACASHPKSGDVDVPGFPIKYVGDPDPKIEAGPEMGEHTAEALRDWLGLDDAEVAALRKARVVI
jgi:crotonobetainyl-CoA:carnitine CoA-transferase CaiB-like acyl-CoA transferase